MKVALFTETYIPDVNGVVAHVKTLREGLEKLGHEVLVVTADKHAKHHYIEDGVLRCPSVEMKKLYGFGVASPYSLKRLKMVRNFDPDVIHIHHEFGIGLSGIMVAKLQKKPLVYTLHTVYDQYIYYIAPKPLLKVATKVSHQYEKFIAETATVLTGPSNKVEEHFNKIGVKNKDVALIPNSADLVSFDFNKVTTKQKDDLRRELGIKKGEMVVCFAGRLAQEKSVDVLLEFWMKTIKPKDKIRLLIVGDGPAMESLMNLARDLKIEKMVTFTGMVKHSEMPAYYAISDVFVSASLSEMNSISMLEAMASGLPVLQRYDELNADQIKAGINGYFYKKPEEMAEKIKEIRSLSEAKLLDLKKQVRLSVVDRGANDLAEYMIRVYKKAIKKSNGKPAKKKFFWMKEVKEEKEEREEMLKKLLGENKD